MRIAAIDHLVVAARRTGHLDHRADHRVYGLVGGQLAVQLVQLGFDLQLLAQQIRRSTVGIGDRRLRHRDILQRQDARIVVQRAGFGRGQLLLAAGLAGHGLRDLVQLVVGHLLVHRLDRDSHGNDALAVFFVDFVVKINVGVQSTCFFSVSMFQTSGSPFCFFVR